MDYLIAHHLYCFNRTKWLSALRRKSLRHASRLAVMSDEEDHDEESNVPPDTPITTSSM